MRMNGIRLFFLVLMILPIVSVGVFIHNVVKEHLCLNEKFDATPPPPFQKIDWPTHGLITIFFDDAYKSQASNKLMKVMQENGFVGAIAVPTGFVCRASYLSWDALHTLQNKGWEITSHSVSHYCDPSKYNAQTTVTELLDSKNALLSRGLRADSFVIPCGFHQGVLPEVVKYAKQHYASYRVAKNKNNTLPLGDRYDLKSYAISSTTDEKAIQQWIDNAKKNNSWLILTFHQIDNDKLIYHTNFQKFSRIMEMIKQSDIPVVVPAQVLGLTAPNKSAPKKL